jgi:hypothetical protein
MEHHPVVIELVDRLERPEADLGRSLFSALPSQKTLPGAREVQAVDDCLDYGHVLAQVVDAPQPSGSSPAVPMNYDLFTGSSAPKRKPLLLRSPRAPVGTPALGIVGKGTLLPNHSMSVW